MPTSLKHPSFWQQGTSNDARGRAYVQGLVQGKRKAGRRRATPWPQTDRSTRPCRPWFSVFACVDQNATLAAGLEFLSDSGCTGRGGLGRDHESGQRVNGSRHVEQLWIGVNVRGQLGLGMPHCGLSRPKRNARGAQVGAESHSEGVHVHDAIPFVTLNHYSVTRLPRPPFKVFRCARFAEIPWFHRSSEIGRDRGVLAAAERASKPNSVVGDHLSGPEVALRLEHPTRSFGTAVGEFGMANGRHSRLCFRSASFHETGRLLLPTWACWRWGLPCRDCHQSRGALLPHHFTLTGPRPCGVFSVALSLGSLRVGVTNHRALSSSDFPPGRDPRGVPRKPPERSPSPAPPRRKPQIIAVGRFVSTCGRTGIIHAPQQRR